MIQLKGIIIKARCTRNPSVVFFLGMTKERAICQHNEQVFAHGKKN
jgi:hypothetical protein